MTDAPPAGATRPRFAELAAALSRPSQAGVWEEVVVIARTLRAEFPLEALGYVRGAFALRQLHRYDEADAVLLDAILLFPGDPQPLIEAVRLAQARTDWGCAARRAAVLAQRFPAQVEGWLVQAYAQRCAGQFAEAERLLADGAARFPAVADFDTEACWLALAQGKGELAVERCASLRSRHPLAPAGYQVGLVALRHLKRWAEARQLLSEAAAHLGTKDWILLESLRLAQQHEDPEKVVELTQQILERTPSEVSAYHIGAWAYRKLGRVPDAETLLRRALSTLPPNAQVLSEYAWAARDRGDWPATDQRWAEAGRIFPQDANIARGQAQALVLPGRKFGKAEVVEAHRLFLEVHERFPELAAAYADHIRMFRTANCPQDAEEVAKLACSRLPDDVQIRLEYSQIAADQGRHEEALARLAEVEDRFRDLLVFGCRRVNALVAAGKDADAEAACTALLARHGGAVEAYCEFAELAMRRHDWKAAALRWTDADRRFPGLPWIRKRLFDAQLALADADHQATQSAADPGTDRDPDGELPTEALVSRFESLAGTFQGCEFGRVQRHFGAEPLGLFRWAQIDIDGLIEAVEARFEGVGSPDQTELLLFDNGEGGFNENTAEYQIGDTRYRMRMHTFIRRDEMPHDKMFSQSVRRLTFLQRKLLEDLTESRKIFVYKRGHATLKREDALRLSRGLAQFSADNVLLCVYLATAERPAGTVEWIAPNLLFGYVTHFSLAPGGHLRVPAYPEWASLCRQAFSLRQGRHATPPRSASAPASQSATTAE